MFQNLKLTTAQSFVLHTLLSIFFGGVATGVTGIASQVASGHMSLPVLLGVGLAGFGGWFVKGFVSLEGNAQTSQAVLDTINEVKSTVSQVIGSHQELRATVNAMVAANAQPVQVHVTTPPAAPATPVSAPAPQAASQPAQSATTPFAPMLNLPTSLPSVSGYIPVVPPVQH